jgi:hypothetical protein
MDCVFRHSASLTPEYIADRCRYMSRNPHGGSQNFLTKISWQKGRMGLNSSHGRAGPFCRRAFVRFSKTTK